MKPRHCAGFFMALIAVVVFIATYIWQENFLLSYLITSLFYGTSCGILGVDILGLDDACGCDSVDDSGSCGFFF